MASRVITRHYDRALAPAGISASAYAILARLDREGSRPLGALAARLAVDRTTLSRELAPLVEAGLVATLADEHDRRRRILALTDAGAARVAAARPLWTRAQEELSDEFGRGRTEGLVAELHALVGAA